MNFNIYNSLILAGIIQGFVFVVVVMSNKKYRKRSIYFLVALILCLTLSNLMYFLPDVGLVSLPNMYRYIYVPLAALFPPIYYFYVIKFLYPEHRTSKTEKLLFLPFLVFMILNIIYRIGILTEYENEGFYSFFNLALNIIEVSSNIFTIVILLFLIWKVFEYEKKHKLFDINNIYNSINWLKGTLIVLTLLSFLWTYLIYENITDQISFYSLWVGMSVVIYWLGYTGIFKFGVLEERKKLRAYYNNVDYSKDKPSKNEHIIALENLLVKEKLFLDSNITLDTIAQKLNISSSHLSRMIHTELNTSFTDYLNALRVNEAKLYLTNPDFSKYTMVAIGLEAGFNSKSAFHNVFKKVTGKTPMQYKKDQPN